MAEPNFEELKRLYKSDKICRAIFNFLADRTNKNPITDADRVRDALDKEHSCNYTRERSREVFSAISKAGFGRFESTNKPGNHDRIHWAEGVNFVTLAQALRDGKAWAPYASAVEFSRLSAAPIQTADVVPVTFPFRGEPFTVHIPRGMTKGEAQELAAFVAKFGK